MNISALDLNLLVALEALLEEASVTHAAQRISISQPAMSHALKRLRVLLGDPLLVRVGTHMGVAAGPWSAEGESVWVGASRWSSAGCDRCCGWSSGGFRLGADGQRPAVSGQPV